MTTRIPDCEILRSTDKAVLVSDGNTEFWVPKSVIDDDSDIWDDTSDARGPGDLVVADWWAERNGHAD